MNDSEALETLEKIYSVLYLDEDIRGPFWNPDKSLDADHLDMFVKLVPYTGGAPTWAGNTSKEVFKVMLLEHDAKPPHKAHPSDAGYDLCTVEDAVLQCGHRFVFRTGLAPEIPPGYAGLIWDRSGWAVANGITVLAGVVDSGYRGEIMVCLQNNGQESVQIRKGDKIAQMLIQPVSSMPVEIVDELSDSERGSDGFGSTG